MNNDRKYQIIIFDIKKHNEMDMPDQVISNYDSYQAIIKTFYDLKCLEKVLAKKILLSDSDEPNLFGYNKYLSQNFMYEPFAKKDEVGITIINGSVTKDFIYKLFMKNIKNINSFNEYHFIYGEYDTNDINKRNDEIYRIDCLNELIRLKKEEFFECKEKPDLMVTTPTEEKLFYIVDSFNEISLICTNHYLKKKGILNENLEYNFLVYSVEQRYKAKKLLKSKK